MCWFQQGTHFADTDSTYRLISLVKFLYGAILDVKVIFILAPIQKFFFNFTHSIVNARDLAASSDVM